MNKLNPFGNRFCRARRWSVLFTLLGVAALTSIPIARAQPLAGKSRYAVVAIDPRIGLATVQDAVTGKTFRFVLNDKRLLSALRVGLAINFNRVNGVMAQGLPARCCRPVKPPTSNQQPQIDCSLTPQLCLGGKPSGPRQTLPNPNGDLIDQVNDFCTDSPDQCVPGLM